MVKNTDVDKSKLQQCFIFTLGKISCYTTTHLSSQLLRILVGNMVMSISGSWFMLHSYSLSIWLDFGEFIKIIASNLIGFSVSLLSSHTAKN